MVSRALKTDVFEQSAVPPPVGSTDFSLHLWEPTRSRGIKPDFAGSLSDDPELRREFLVGARMMGYELVDLDDLALIEAMKAMSPPRFALQPQQLYIADALNSDHDEDVVEIMRRGGKTTTIFCWCLGRCHERPGFQVTFSAQSGVKSSARLREWKNRLDRTCPDPEAGIPPWRRGLSTKSKALSRQIALFGDELLPDAAIAESTSRGFRILMGEVGKGIYFDNGAQFLVFKPDADAYRGEAGDVSWLDEAQELDPEEGADLLAGIVPLQDTKEGAKLVISLTAGEARVGVAWDRINRLRSGDPDIGGIDYCFPEDTPLEVLQDEDQAMELVARHHPGVGTLTTIEKMRKNYRKLGVPQWSREYGSLWPETYGIRAIPEELLVPARLKKHPTRPVRVAFGMSIKPGGAYACIVAAWRSPTGIAYGEIIAHQQSTRWLPPKMQHLTSTYRGSSIAYDDIAEGKATVTEAERLRPKPRMQVQTYRETGAGCIQLERDLRRGTARFAPQGGFEAAFEKLAKREVRGDQGVWLWTPSEAGADISPIDAWTRALRNWDQHFAKKPGTRRGPAMGE